MCWAQRGRGEDRDVLQCVVSRFRSGFPDEYPGKWTPAAKPLTMY